MSHCFIFIHAVLNCPEKSCLFISKQNRWKNVLVEKIVYIIYYIYSFSMKWGNEFKVYGISDLHAKAFVPLTSGMHGIMLTSELK